MSQQVNKPAITPTKEKTQIEPIVFIEEEEDLLDLAWGVRHNSRLGCQIIITDALDGVRFFILTDTTYLYT